MIKVVDTLNYTINDIIAFLIDLSKTDEINADSDIFGDVGMVGDDFHEMIEKYAKQFSVDMTGYLWYFHTYEEGQSMGGNFIESPYERVERIPITPTMLLEFAIKGKGDIHYLPKKIPKSQ